MWFGKQAEEQEEEGDNNNMQVSVD